MKNLLKMSGLWALMAASTASAHPQDDPLLTKVFIDRIEWYPEQEADALVWDVESWAGYDLNKVWLKTDGEVHDGEVEAAQIQLLYGRAIAPYWDAQVGWRHDFKPGEEQDWLALSLTGLMPFFFETEVAFFADASGATALTFETERELMLTQKWVLSPEIELSAYGQNDELRGQGSGLSTLEAGLRLRYEIRREFAPYVGVVWEKSFGNTADLARVAGEGGQETQWVAGIRAWF